MHVPVNELKFRLEKLHLSMKQEKVGAVYLCRPENVHYFSGFTGSDSHLLVTASEMFLLTDRRYEEEAQQSASCAEMVLWKKNIPETAAEIFRKKRVRAVGFEADMLTQLHFSQFTKALSNARTKDFRQQIATIRLCKTSWELGRIKAALRCAEKSFLELKHVIRCGMTELDIRAELEMRMLKYGAIRPAFETIVAVGKNSSLPHAHAGKVKVRQGLPILIDFGACVDGYNSDLTRVLFLGSMPKFWHEQMRRVLQAQSAGLDALKAGCAVCDADNAARKVFEQYKCVQNYSHSLGHGLGLMVHEAPGVSYKSSTVLEEGMVVTCEPGLYYPGKGGIRIEDMVVVSRRGASVLSRLDKDEKSAVLSL